jgi:hypothetical protein
MIVRASARVKKWVTGVDGRTLALLLGFALPAVGCSSVVTKIRGTVVEAPSGGRSLVLEADSSGRLAPVMATFVSSGAFADAPQGHALGTTNTYLSGEPRADEVAALTSAFRDGRLKPIPKAKVSGNVRYSPRPIDAFQDGDRVDVETDARGHFELVLAAPEDAADVEVGVGVSVAGSEAWRFNVVLRGMDLRTKKTWPVELTDYLFVFHDDRAK